MPNVLGIPYPQTAPVDVRDGLRAHLHTNFPDIDPQLLERDIEAWQDLRRKCVSRAAPAGPSPLLRDYAAQLDCAVRMLKNKAGTAFPWTPGFSNAPPMQCYESIDAERAYVLLWIAAEHAQSASCESRSTSESLKRAANEFQMAAGCLAHMATLPLPAPLQDQVPCLRHLMLAQAQECFWQKAVQDGLRDTTIAKLAQGVSTLYADSVALAPPSALPTDWLQHMECKRWHFAAAAMYRKSCDDLAQRRHADELGRLMLAASYVERARRAGTRAVATAVVDDVQSLYDIIHTNLVRADKDNELIYLAAPTNAAHLPDMGTALLAVERCPTPIQAPVAYLAQGQQEAWFQRLMTYGVDVAVRLYADRKAQFLEHTLEAMVSRLDAQLEGALSSMQMAETLQRLDRPQRLPTHWNEYVSGIAASGVRALEEQMQRVMQQADMCRAAYEQARPYHDEAVLREYETALSEACRSDQQVRASIEQVAPLARIMERGMTALHAWAMPTLRDLQRASEAHTDDIRGIHAMIEQLRDGAQARRRLVLRARAEMDSDDLRETLMHMVRARQVGDAVPAAALDDVLDKSMQRYDVYLCELKRCESEQHERMRQLKQTHMRLLRQADVAQALDAQAEAWHRVEEAYGQWEALRQHVAEGRVFYETLYDRCQRLAGV